jgi:lysozyme
MVIGGRDYSNALQIAVDHLKRSEDFRSEAYPDAGYKWKAPTIGYGTAYRYPSSGEPIRRGDTITEEQALNELLLSVLPTLEMIHNNVKTPLNDNQVAALISFTYNVGDQAFLDSTLLKKINEGDLESVSGEMSRWVYSNGQRIGGLEKRRRDDFALFNTPGDMRIDSTFSDIDSLARTASIAVADVASRVTQGVGNVVESLKSAISAGVPAEETPLDFPEEAMPEVERSQQRQKPYAERYKLMEWPGVTAPLSKQLQFIRQRVQAWEADRQMKDTED